MPNKRKPAMSRLSADIISALSTVAGLDRRTKKAIAFLADSAICLFAIWLAFSLRLGDWQLWNGPVRTVM